jgi:Na+/melibiose symporter-like transporter
LWQNIESRPMIFGVPYGRNWLGARLLDRGLRRQAPAPCATSSCTEIDIMAETSTPSASRIPERAQSAFSHADVMHVMFGIMICILLAALDQTAVIPAVPAIASDLGSYTGLSWVVAAYLITSTISTPVYGKLSDIYGRRQLLITCLALFIVTSMLCGWADRFTNSSGYARSRVLVAAG